LNVVAAPTPLTITFDSAVPRKSTMTSADFFA
jgi:hypothetical protein